MKTLKALSLGEGLGEAAFVDGEKPAGEYEIEFSAKGGSASGVYF